MAQENGVAVPEDVKSLSESVLDRLRDAILSGELPPGAKISELKVARHFGVSRAPLREAIRHLQERNLITRLPRIGARVVVLSPERIRQIFIAREAIEGMATRQAALYITDEEIRRLRACLEHQSARSAEIGAVAYLTNELDNDFHSAIVRASRNEYLVKAICDDFGALVELCRRQQRRLPERAQRALIEHSRIVDALEERDGDLAELMMRRHIAAACRGLLASLKAPRNTGYDRRSSSSDRKTTRKPVS